MLLPAETNMYEHINICYSYFGCMYLILIGITFYLFCIDIFIEYIPNIFRVNMVVHIA